MAKIKQLGETFRKRPDSAITPALRVDLLAPGLRNASNAWLESIKIKDNMNAQRSKAETDRASIQMKDWMNQYMLSMNSPDKIRESFENTEFNPITAAMNANAGMMESSKAQGIVRQAAGIIGKSINDPNAREAFMNSTMMGWESIEPAYQSQAESYKQQEAKSLNLATLGEIWKSDPAGIKGEHFNSFLDQMYAEGQFGVDADAAIATMNGIVNSYGKAQQTAFIENQLAEALEPMRTKTYTDAELNVTISGAATTAEGLNFLTKEETDKILKTAFNKAKNQAAVFQNLMTVESEKVKSSYWQMAQETMSGDLSPGEKRNTLQALTDQISGLYGKEMGRVATDDKEFPFIDLDTWEDQDLNQLMTFLNKGIKGEGLTREQEAAGAITLTNLVGSAEKSFGEQVSGTQEMLMNGDISLPMYNSAMNDINTLNKSQYYQEASTAALQLSNDLELSTGERANLNKQLQTYFTSARNTGTLSVEADYRAIIKDYATDSKAITRLINLSQDGKSNFWSANVQGFRNGYFKMEDGLKEFQKQIDSGNMAGMVGMRPGAFSDYVDSMTVNFKTGVNEGNLNELDMEGLQFSDDNPVVIASLVNVYGNSLIAVPKIYQGDAEPGTTAVRVFSATSQSRNFLDAGDGNELSYLEETEYTDYYVVKHMIDGVPVQKIVVDTGFYTDTAAGRSSQLREISLDPNAMSGRRSAVLDDFGEANKLDQVLGRN